LFRSLSVIIVVGLLIQPLAATDEIKTQTRQPIATHGKHVALIDIRDVAISGENVVVVTDPAPSVHVFGPDGHRGWGEKGMGPGDVGNPKSVLFQEGTVAVLNLRPNKVVLFDITGDLRDSFTIPDVSYVTRFERMGDAFIIESAEPGNQPNGLWHFDAPTLTPIFELAQPEKIQLRDPDGPIRNYRIRPPYAPRPRWTVIEGRTIGWWDGRGEMIRHLDKDLKPHSTTMLQLEKRPIQPGTHDIWLDETLPPNESLFDVPNAYRDLRVIAKKEVTFPAHFPLILDLEPDPRGGFWVLRSEGSDGEEWARMIDGVPGETLLLEEGERLEAIGRHVFAIVTESPEGSDLVTLYHRD